MNSNDGLKIMLSRIILRPNIGEHAKVSIPQILGDLGECYSLGQQETQLLSIATVALA